MGGKVFVCPRKLMGNTSNVCAGIGTRGQPSAGKYCQWKNIRLYFSVDVTGEDIAEGLKMAATLLNYPSTHGIPIACINMHSL